MAGAEILIKEISQIFARIFYVVSPRDLAVQFPPEPPLSPIRYNYQPLILFVFGLFFLFTLISLIRNARLGQNNFLIIFCGVVFIGITVYNIFFPGYTYEWFFTVALPAFAIFFGVGLSKLNLKFAAFTISLFSLINISNNFFVENSFGYTKKIDLLKWAKSEIKDDNYSLIPIGKTYFYSGYRYLADQLNFSPTKSCMDIYYEWLYPIPSVSAHPKTVLVVVNYSPYEDKIFWQKLKRFKQKSITSKIDYPLEALTIDNRDGWLNRINYDCFK